MSVPRPPPYKRTIWEYDKANIDMTKHDLSGINWYEMFDGLDVNQAVDSFTMFFLVSNCSRDYKVRILGQITTFLPLFHSSSFPDTESYHQSFDYPFN